MMADDTSDSDADGTATSAPLPTLDDLLGTAHPGAGRPLPRVLAVANQKGSGSVFSSIDEVRYAFDAGALALHAKIKVRIGGEVFDTTTGANTTYDLTSADGQGNGLGACAAASVTDDAGLPTWIIVNGKQAQRREKQGDVWYSIKLGDDSYERILTIPKSETAPAVHGV